MSNQEALKVQRTKYPRLTCPTLKRASTSATEVVSSMETPMVLASRTRTLSFSAKASFENYRGK